MKKKFIAVILILTLICSSAVTLASAKNVMLGDVNNDGKITAADARLTLRASAKLEKLSEEKKLAADVNFDGKITASDARKILRASAKIEALPEMPTTTTKPSTTKPSTTKPTTTKPSTTKPTTTKPSTTKPTTTKPSTTKPSTTKPTTTTPSTTKPTTTKPSTTKPTTTKPNNDINRKYPAAIDAFLNGKYYLEAITESDGSTAEMKIAMSEKGYEITASAELVEGSPAMELGFMQLGESLYIKYPNILGIKKVYLMDEELKNEMGFNSEEMFGSLFEYLDFTSIKINKDPVKTKGKYNGKACDIYTFKTEEGKIIFYAIGEEVKKINIFDKAGNEQAVIDVKLLSADIPENMLSTKGHKKADLLEFFADMMMLMPDETA